LLLELAGCRLIGDYKRDKIMSPTKKYYLTATVNRTNSSKEDYASVIIHLYSFDGQLLSNFDTRASDASTWAVGWDKSRDTIILYSGDINNVALKIENGQLKHIELSGDLNARANELTQEKYKE
jgi:hypothetical protein